MFLFQDVAVGGVVVFFWHSCMMHLIMFYGKVVAACQDIHFVYNLINLLFQV